MSKELRRSKIFQKTGCTRLCFFLGGIGASLTIGATSLTYLFLHEQLEFTASLLAKERVSAACGALHSLTFELLESSPNRADPKRDLPAWTLGTGNYTADDIRWTSPPESELKRNVTRIPQQQAVHTGYGNASPTTEPERNEAAHELRHSTPKNACTLHGVQKIGEGRALPVALFSIPGEQQPIALAILPDEGIALDENDTGRFAIIDLTKMINSFARNENQSLMSSWLPDRKAWLKIKTALSIYSMDNVKHVGDNHIHYLTNPPDPIQRQKASETGLHQTVLLTPNGMEVIYEAWVDYRLLDRLPKRIAGLIFIIGLMSSGVGVMMSRNALIKEAKISEELRRQSRTDSLTELPNRREWDERLDRENNILQRHNRSYAIAVIDLDGFKAINDSLGHAAGDLLLKRAGKILKAMIRSEDIAARVGGDEFTVLFCEPTDDGEGQLLKRLETAFNEQGISTSIGIAYSQPNQTLMGLWHRADELMYDSKTAKKTTKEGND